MNDTNPISFSDIFNFADAAPMLKEAIEGMRELEKTSKAFYDTMLSGNADRISKEIDDIKAKILELGKALQSNTGDTKAHQEAILQSVSAVQNYSSALQVATEQKKAAKAADDTMTDSLAALKQELKDLKTQWDNLSTTSAGYKEKSDTIIARTAVLTGEINELNTAFKTTVAVQAAAANSYAALDAETKKLVADLKQMEGGMTAGNAKTKEMQTRIFENIQALKQFDAQMNVHNRSVGDYAKATFAVSQVLREAPAFAYSFSTGLLGISNNIPILVDQINALKESNAALVAQGQQAIPIWKIFADAILSPVGIITVLTAGLTILSARMKSTGDMVKETEQANLALAAAFDKVAESIQKNIDQQKALDILYNDNAANRKAVEDNTVDGAKRTEAAIKAQGTTAAEVYAHEKEMLEQANEVRQQELKLIEEKRKTLDLFDKFRAAAQGADWNRTDRTAAGEIINNITGGRTGEGSMNTALRESGIDEIEQKKMRAAFNEAVKSGANLNDVLEQMRRENARKAEENEVQQANKKKEIENATSEFINKKRMEVEELHKKMVADHLATDENYFQQVLALRNNDLDSINLSIDREQELRLKQLAAEKEIIRKKYALKGENIPGGVEADFTQKADDIVKDQTVKRLALIKDYYDKLGTVLENSQAEAESYFQTIRKLNDEIDALGRKQLGDNAINEIKLRQAGNVNPGLAVFGVEDTQAKFEADQSIRDVKIKAKQDDIRRLQDDLEAQKASPDYSPVKELELEKSIAASEVDLNQQTADKNIAIAEREAAAKKQIYQKSFELIVTAVNAQYEHQRKLLDQQMAAVQAQAQFETELAGNNAEAKRKIATSSQAKMLELKRKEAQADKEQAIFQAAISVAAAIAKALTAGPIIGQILAGVTAAIGLVQIAKISSTPLPQYWKGRKGGKAEFAIINELGPEAVGKNGKYRIENSGKPTATFLQEGESVIPHEDTAKMVASNSQAKNWMDVLLEGSGAHRQIEDNKTDRIVAALVHPGVSKKEYEEAMVSALRQVPQQVIQMPAQDVQDRYNKTLRRNGL